MASATLEMFIKMVGVNKVASELDKIEKGARDLDDQINKSEKTNRKMSDSMSALRKTAIAGGAIFATKALFDFSKSAVEASVAADEAAAAFGTTFGSAAERATRFLEDFANKAGLTVGEAQQLQATLGAVAQGIGFTQEESADLAIELTKIAADVASFSNISAGAEPVLRAFQSALLGENEALKTYGIAILSSEVNTKALEETSKTTAEALTKQEKALATLTLINEKAAVQIGDLDRTFTSFANQSRAVGAELRTLREDIGKELIPALEVLLPKFRELVQDIAPSLIEGFGLAATTVIDLVLALDRFNDLDEGLIFFIKNFKELADEQRKFNELSARAGMLATDRIVKEALLNREKRKSRNETNLQRVAFEKFDTQLQKKSIPQLKTYLELVGILNAADEDLTSAEDELKDAKERVTEAQRTEALATAEERLQKKELQAQIQELLFFQEKGVNVSEELAVATEKLRLVEFELTRESEELRDAKSELADIEDSLKTKVDETTEAFEKNVDQFIKLNEASEIFKALSVDNEFMELLIANDMLNPFLAANLDNLSKLAKLQGLDDRARELGRMADAAERLADAQSRGNIPRTSFTPAATPTIPDTSTILADQRLMSLAASAPQVTVQIGEETIDSFVAESNQRNEDRSGFFSELLSRIQ